MIKSGLRLWAVLTLWLAISPSAVAEDKPRIEVVPQIPHSGLVIWAVAFSPDGRELLSGGGDHVVKLWDAASAQLLRSFDGHSGWVSSVAFSPDGRQLLSGSWDKTVKLWDAASGKCLRSFEGHSGPINSVAFSPDGRQVLSGSKDGTIKLWDVASPDVHTFEENSVPVNSVAFSPDGRQVLSGSEDGTIKLWDVATGRVHLVGENSSPVNSVAFSPNGRQVLSASEDGAIKFWDVTSGEVRNFEQQSEAIRSVAFSPNGQHVVSGGFDGTIRIWEVASGHQVNSFDGHFNLIHSVTFSPDGQEVLSAGGGKTGSTMKLLDAASGHVKRVFEGRSDPVMSAVFAPNAQEILSGDKTVKLWDAASAQLLRSFDGHSGWVSSVAFSPDGRQLLSGSWDKTVKLWDAASGKCLRSFEGHSGPINSVAFSPDGRQVLSGSKDGTIKLWDVASPDVHTFEENSVPVNSVAFSPDGRQVLSGSEDGTIKLWDVATGRVHLVGENSSPVNSVAFSPNGRQVLSASEDGAIKFWDVTSGEVRNFEQQSEAIRSVAFSPNGQHVVSGGNDSTVKLWDVASGKMRAFEGQSGRVKSVAFSPDGRRVVSGSNDSTIRIWKTETGELLVTLIGARDGEWLAITPDGFFVASDGGLNMLAVVRRLEVYDIEQFRDQLERKDLVRELLAGDHLKIYAKEAALLNLEDILASGASPEIDLVGREAAGDGVRLTVRLFNNIGGGIGTKLKWRVNGVLQGDIEPEALKNLAGSNGPVTVTQGLTLDPKRDNVITVTAYNGKDLLATRPYRIEVSKGDILAPEERHPRLYIVGIGVNTYTGPKLKSLLLAVTDVTELATALVKVAEAGGYDVPEPILLPEDKATKDDIKRKFEDIAALELQQQDALIVLLAGHGVSDGKCYYYVPFGAKLGDGRDITTEGVTCEDWEQWIGKVQVGKKALFIDTCESADATTIFRGRGDDETRRESTFERIGRSSGQSIFTAARSAAQEDGELGHGLLTYAVLQALAKPGRHGDIDADDIKIYVDDEVPRLSERWYRERQEPVVKVVGSFPLGPPQQVKLAIPVAALPGQYVIIGDGPITYRLEDKADAEASGSIEPYSLVRVYEKKINWVLIGRGGKKMGWVPADAVREVH